MCHCVSLCSGQAAVAVLPVPVPTSALCVLGAAAGAQLQAQAAKLLAWQSTGSLAEPGIELQSAVFQALAFSHRPSHLSLTDMLADSRLLRAGPAASAALSDLHTPDV